MKVDVSRSLSLCFGLPVVLAACGDDAPAQKPPIQLGDTGKTVAFAVVSSDYQATSVSLLDARGEVVADDYVSSGSAKPGLVAALSGDVELPTQAGEPGVLVLLDRYKTDVITRIDLATGEVLGQVKTHDVAALGENSAYSSNPHDYIYVDGQTAWVTRYEPNLDPDVPPIDQGTDLVRIDPTTMSLTGDRVDLSELNTTGTRTDPDTGKEETVTVYARPSSAVRLRSTLVVGLSRLSFDFSAVGDGALAVVDLDQGTVSGHPVDGLTNCASVVPVEGDDSAVIVSCTGFFGGERRDTAGLVLLELQQGKLRELARWAGAEHDEQVLAVNNPVSLGGTLVAATSYGARDSEGKLAEPDVLALIDLASAAQTVLDESEGVYTLGQGVYASDERILLVPDASTDADKNPTRGILRFSIDKAGTAMALDTVQVEGRGMPVRQIRPL